MSLLGGHSFFSVSGSGLGAGAAAAGAVTAVGLDVAGVPDAAGGVTGGRVLGGAVGLP